MRAELYIRLVASVIAEADVATREAVWNSLACETIRSFRRSHPASQPAAAVEASRALARSIRQRLVEDA